MANENLGAAKKAKQDEFYTQYADIEKEMNAYLEYNPHVFRGKRILLPCDDPEWSNFTRYFAQNFETFGLKKLISTSYAPNSKPIDVNYQPPLFELESEKFDEEKTRSNGKIFTLTQDVTGDQKINVDDLEWSYLEGDGDFRSEEVTKLREEADFIITNPPFSLFREFLAWTIDGGCQFSVIGSKNVITYKELFPLIKDNKMWLGYGFNGGNAFFTSPFSRDWAAGVYDEKTGLLKFRNLNWFTDIEHGKRYQELPLMTMDDNIKFSKHKQVKDVGYQTYDNYDAIEVPFTDAIPSDYDGVMGVPISFLDKYNPEQFEIVGDSQAMASELGIGPVGQEFVDLYYSQGNKGQIGASWPYLVLKVDGMAVIPYKRILIRHKGIK
jgi:hypothetical protein